MHCRCVGYILILILVTELIVMPLDVVTLYCKDNGTIAFAKEPRSHQIFQHKEQQNMRLPQVEIHRGVESELHM